MTGSELLLEYLSRYFPILLFVFIAFAVWRGHPIDQLFRSTEVSRAGKIVHL